MNTKSWLVLVCSLAFTGCLQVSVLKRGDTALVGPTQTEISFTAPAFTAPVGRPFTTGAPQVISGKIANCKVSPALAAGLSINGSTCEISGTPSSLSGKTYYKVSFNDGVEAGSVFVEIEVANIVPELTYSLGSYNFSLNDAASTTGVPANAGGAIENCVVAPALPAGLSLNTTSCSISGKPTAVTATGAYVITASNSAGDAADVTLNIQVSNTAPEIEFAAGTYTFDLKDAASATDIPVNHAGAVTSCSVSPALPAGLSVDQSTCRIAGTPSAVAAAADYTVTPSNAVGAGAGVTVSIEVRNVVPQIAYSSSTFTFNLHEASTTGAPTSSKGAITNCAVSPALPAGLTLDAATCAISGTPSEVTASTVYAVTPKNAMGDGAAVNVTLTVANVAPSIAYSSAEYEFDYNASVSTGVPVNSGGAIKDCTADLKLPAGLSIDSNTCEISGTPVEVFAKTEFMVVATNDIGAATAVSVTLTVNDVVPALSYKFASYVWNLGATAATDQPTNGGGTLTGCTVSPALPSGLSLHATTCVISGTPTAVSAAQSYSITPSSSAGAGSVVTLSLRVANVVPSLTYSSNAYIFNLNSVSTSGVPTNAGGAITGCTVSPALPAGLTLSGTTCEVRGTPTVVSAATAYSITASNEVGEAAAKSVTIRVNNVVPNITYASEKLTFIVGTLSAYPVTKNTGGAVTSCSISPALPSGLTLNSSNCTISGTPVAATMEGLSFTVTPSNAVGSGPGVPISISVGSGGK